MNADKNGWVRFKDRWPTEAECDAYGNIEVAARGARGFTTLAFTLDWQYSLKIGSWWRTPTALPDMSTLP